MQIAAQDWMRLVENAQTLYFVDIEATGLKGDYNSVLCMSMKPYGKKPFTFAVDTPGKDKKLIKDISEALLEADGIVTYYGKGFDWKMLNTRALKHSLEPLKPIPHIDLYYSLKYHLLTARKSQGHLLSWLEIERTKDELIDGQSELAEKLTVSAEAWNRILANPEKEMKQMIRRCESDVCGLEALYRRTKHLIRDVKQ